MRNIINRLANGLQSSRLTFVFASLFIGTMLTSAPQAVLAANAPINPNVASARVSFTFDDGFESMYTVAAPSLAKFGMAGVGYVVTGCVGMTTTPNTCRADDNKPYMTWDQVTALQNQYGWEIGSHTVTHPLLVSADEGTGAILTPQQRITEISQSKNDLAAHGIDAVSFADPYGDWNFTSLAEIAQYYAIHRPFADVVNATHNNIFPYSDYLPYVVQVQDGVTFDMIKPYIDAAKAGNHWLVLVFHDIIAGNGSTASTDGNQSYSYNAAGLEQIAAYIQSQNIAVTTMKDSIARGTNILPNSSFDNGIADGWTTDSADITVDNANHGSYNGTATGPVNAIKLGNTSATANAHLFSPLTTIDPTKRYIFKSFLNVTQITSGSVGFYVDEYDVNGAYLATQAKPAEVSIWLSSMNFEYVPTSAAVSKVRIQISVAPAGNITAYLDNVQLFDSGAPVVVAKTGDANGDGLVNIQDATIVSLNWNKTAATRAMGDVSGDGVVNIQDATLIALNWSK